MALLKPTAGSSKKAREYIGSIHGYVAPRHPAVAADHNTPPAKPPNQLPKSCPQTTTPFARARTKPSGRWFTTSLPRTKSSRDRGETKEQQRQSAGRAPAPRSPTKPPPRAKRRREGGGVTKCRHGFACVHLRRSSALKGTGGSGVSNTHRQEGNARYLKV